MTDDGTLLAHLAPRLASQLEDAATDALAYILNKSDEAMRALNDLLQHGGFGIEPIRRVRTQVSYKDGSSRPDMTGEDRNRVERLLVESKFGAPLLDGQASGYIKLLDKPGPAVLMFISPEVRIETLWAAIRQQMEPCIELKPVDAPAGVRRAEAGCPERHLILISWLGLLDCMAAYVSDAAVEEDIRQLRGLALQQDSEAFRPVHAEHLSPDFARRVVGYNHLVDDAVDARGVKDGWLDISGLSATSQRYGYGRYVRFKEVPGDCWFGVNHEQWAKNEDTPLWLLLHEDLQARTDEIGKKLDRQVYDGWVPIFPKLRVEEAEVLNDMVRQLKVIARVVGVHT